MPSATAPALAAVALNVPSALMAVAMSAAVAVGTAGNRQRTAGVRDTGRGIGADHYHIGVELRAPRPLPKGSTGLRLFRWHCASTSVPKLPEALVTTLPALW